MNKEEIIRYKVKKAAFFSILVSAILCVLKFYVYRLTASCSLHASAMDSLMDTFVAIINLSAVYVVYVKKNNIAPLGWDKLSPVVSIFHCTGIFIFSVKIIEDILKRLLSNQPQIHDFEFVLFVPIISFILTLMLILYQREVVKQTDSLIIKTDMIHFFSDLYSNVFMFLGFIFMKFFNIAWIDLILGVIVSFYLIMSIINLFKISIYSLLDLNFIEEQKKILNLLNDHNFHFEKENLWVTFSGKIVVVNIQLNKNQISNIDTIRKITANISNIETSKTCKSHNCSHVCGTLSNKLIKTNFFLK